MFNPMSVAPASNVPNCKSEVLVSVRLFVGNLPYDTTEAELRDYLSAVGTLSSVYLPMNRETGKPRGFAFVEFAESEQGQEAIRRFNNQPFKGRNLSISEARAREARPPDDSRRFGPPRDMRSPMGAPMSRPPRLERTIPPADMEQSRAGRTGRAPERRRTTGARKPADFSSRGERGPKKPIREKPGGRLYDDFDDLSAGPVEELLEDDFSRRVEESEAEGEEP